MTPSAREFFSGKTHLFIQQMKEWVEILTDFETKNKYQVLSNQGEEVGYVAEAGSGLWRIICRLFFRSHRPLDIRVWNKSGEEILKIKRPFFWFFSSLTVYGTNGQPLGEVHRRFAFFTKKYSLINQTGNEFLTIKAGIFKIWTFPMYDDSGQEVGKISKEWGGLLKEVFTDADRFGVEFPDYVSEEEKAVVFATAISIDFDFFEDNAKQQDDFGVG